MPGHCCIVPECKSSYDSCSDKRHFFTIPKDENILNQWTNAIPRKHFVMKPGQVVCEQHFHEEEILRKQVMTHNDGNILAQVYNKLL